MKVNRRWNNTYTLLFINSLLCVLLLFSRILISHSNLYLFLIWNLFLAAIPWLISNTILHNTSLRSRKWVLIITGALWLLFFPNAPYILTDLFHLKRPSAIPVWFDLTLLLAASWTGLMFGFVSIRQVDHIMSGFFSARVRVCLITLVFFISGFGIYLGRYLRWNSWDIVRQPSAFFFDITSIIVNPIQNIDTWAMTIIFGTFLSLIYWSIMLLNAEKRTQYKF